MHIHNWCVHPNLNKQTFKHTHNMPELKHGTHTLTDEKKMHAMMFYDNFGNCYNCWYSIIRHFPLFSCNPGGVANWGISPRLEFKLKSFEVLVLRLLNRKTAQPVACETTQTPWALHWISIQVLWLPIHPDYYFNKNSDFNIHLDHKNKSHNHIPITDRLSGFTNM